MIKTFKINLDCKKIIEFFENDKNKEFHSFNNCGNNNIQNKLILRGIYDYEYIKNIFPELEIEIVKSFEKYKKNLENYFCPVDYKIDTFVIKKYLKGASMKLHVDNNTLNSSKRFLTFLIYLNNCDSGYTIFPNQKIKIKPIENQIIFFPPYWEYPHMVETVNENRYIINGFFEIVL